MNKKELSERDACTKFIAPALRQAGWDQQTQLREKVSFTKGRVIVRGKMVTRGAANRADYILYYKANILLTVFEAKDNNCAVGDGLQQALEYAKTLDLSVRLLLQQRRFVFHDGRADSRGARRECGPSLRHQSKLLETPAAREAAGLRAHLRPGV